MIESSLVLNVSDPVLNIGINGSLLYYKASSSFPNKKLFSLSIQFKNTTQKTGLEYGAAWPANRRNMMKSGMSPFFASVSNPIVRWKYDIGSRVLTQAIIDSEGRVYIVIEGGCLVCIAPPSRTSAVPVIVWSYCNELDAYSTPNLMNYQSVVVFKTDGNMLRISKLSGSLLTSINMLHLANLRSSMLAAAVQPLLQADGRIILFTSDGTLCVSKDYNTPGCMWVTYFGETIVAASLDKWDNIVVAMASNYVYQMNLKYMYFGSKQNIKLNILDVICSSGAVYYSYDLTLHKTRANSTAKLLAFNRNDGSVFMASGNELNTTNNKNINVFRVKSNVVLSPPVIDVRNTVCVGDSEGYLHYITRRTCNPYWVRYYGSLYTYSDCSFVLCPGDSVRISFGYTSGGIGSDVTLELRNGTTSFQTFKIRTYIYQSQSFVVANLSQTCQTYKIVPALSIGYSYVYTTYDLRVVKKPVSVSNSTVSLQPSVSNDGSVLISSGSSIISFGSTISPNVCPFGQTVDVTGLGAEDTAYRCKRTFVYDWDGWNGVEINGFVEYASLSSWVFSLTNITMLLGSKKDLLLSGLKLQSCSQTVGAKIGQLILPLDGIPWLLIPSGYTISLSSFSGIMSPSVVALYGGLDTSPRLRMLKSAVALNIVKHTLAMTVIESHNGDEELLVAGKIQSEGDILHPDRILGGVRYKKRVVATFDNIGLNTSNKNITANIIANVSQQIFNEVEDAIVHVDNCTVPKYPTAMPVRPPDVLKVMVTSSLSAKMAMNGMWTPSCNTVFQKGVTKTLGVDSSAVNITGVTIDATSSRRLTAMAASVTIAFTVTAMLTNPTASVMAAMYNQTVAALKDTTSLTNNILASAVTLGNSAMMSASVTTVSGTGVKMTDLSTVSPTVTPSFLSTASPTVAPSFHSQSSQSSGGSTSNSQSQTVTIIAVVVVLSVVLLSCTGVAFYCWRRNRSRPIKAINIPVQSES